MPATAASQNAAFMDVPDLSVVEVVWSSAKHLPRFDTLPEEFQRERSPYCRAVKKWFFSGAQAHPNGILIDGDTFIARPGVDAKKALRAIKAALGSFEPKHEHKIAGCGFMLSQWFEKSAEAPAP